MLELSIGQLSANKDNHSKRLCKEKITNHFFLFLILVSPREPHFNLISI
jgi:hypothetical protein